MLKIKFTRQKDCKVVTEICEKLLNMIKNENKVVFNGKNFEKMIKKIPGIEGSLFIVGLKGEKRIPLSMFNVRCKRFERKENIKSKFLKKVNDRNGMDRKDHLEKMLIENGWDKIVVEWEN